MKGLNVPIYMYEYGTNVQMDVGSMLILQDDELINTYRAYTSSTVVQTYSDQHLGSIASTVNGFFGKPVLNTETKAYCKISQGETVYDFKEVYNRLNVNLVPVFGTNNNNGVFKTINDSSFQNLLPNNATPISRLYASTPTLSSNVHLGNKEYTVTVRIFAEDMFASDGSVNNKEGLEITLSGEFNTARTEITKLVISVRYNSDAWYIWLPAFNLLGAQGKDTDVNNPFPTDPNDGGDGDNLPPEIDPTAVPELPSVSIANSGLITIYNPTLAQLQNLGAYLWSGVFDPDSFKKLFADPMEAMIGLAIVPAIPSTAGSKNIRFGNVDSGVSAAYFNTQYVNFKCGSVKINKQVGSFLDYDATKISLFLPYIGFREIAATDVMGASISVEYNIDILNGSCAAFVVHSSRGVIYAYNGSCITNVPLTAANYSGAIQNAVSTVASGVGVIAGMATGAAPVTMASAASMLTAGANTIMSTKPNIQRSGNLGGSAGMLTAKRPFVIIERPNYSVPDYYQNYEGRMCNKTAKLSSLSGFTMVDTVHLDNVEATTSEITEIEAMLKAGVIL